MQDLHERYKLTITFRMQSTLNGDKFELERSLRVYKNHTFLYARLRVEELGRQLETEFRSEVLNYTVSCTSCDP